MLINESSFAPPSTDETERVDTVKQDVKFVNSLLSQCGLEAPFPFSRVVADPVTPSDLYHLETATKILISLLNSKQVCRGWLYGRISPCLLLEGECF